MIELPRSYRNDNANSDTADPGGPQSLPPSPGHENECVVEMEVRSHDLNPNVIDFNGQSALSSPDFDEPEAELGSKDSVSMPPDNSLPTTEPSGPPQPSSLWSLNFPYHQWKSNTQPNNTRSTLPVAVNRYLVIGSCICLLAFLAYRKNSHN